jgi:hypothetical protein
VHLHIALVRKCPTSHRRLRSTSAAQAPTGRKTTDTQFYHGPYDLDDVNDRFLNWTVCVKSHGRHRVIECGPEYGSGSG